MYRAQNEALEADIETEFLLLDLFDSIRFRDRSGQMVMFESSLFRDENLRMAKRLEEGSVLL